LAKEKIKKNEKLYFVALWRAENNWFSHFGTSWRLRQPQKRTFISLATSAAGVVYEPEKSCALLCSLAEGGLPEETPPL